MGFWKKLGVAIWRVLKSEQVRDIVISIAADKLAKRAQKAQ